MINIKSIIQNPKEHKPFYISIGVIVLCLVGLLFYQNSYNHSYASLKQADSPTELYNQVQNNQSKSNLTYEFYYRTDCKDCQHMAKIGLIPYLKEASKKHPLVAVETTTFKKANQQKALQWYGTNNILHTPTLVVRSHGYLIYSYAGDDLNTFKKLLNGINPQTNQTLSTNKHPKKAYLQDDFTKNKTMVDPIAIPILK